MGWAAELKGKGTDDASWDRHVEDMRIEKLKVHTLSEGLNLEGALHILSLINGQLVKWNSVALYKVGKWDRPFSPMLLQYVRED